MGRRSLVPAMPPLRFPLHMGKREEHLPRAPQTPFTRPGPESPGGLSSSVWLPCSHLESPRSVPSRGGEPPLPHRAERGVRGRRAPAPTQTPHGVAWPCMGSGFVLRVLRGQVTAIECRIHCQAGDFRAAPAPAAAWGALNKTRGPPPRDRECELLRWLPTSTTACRAPPSRGLEAMQERWPRSGAGGMN